MNEIERVITIFRKRRDVNSDKIYEALIAYGIDVDTVQNIYQNESPGIVTFFRVHTLPTVLLFTDGEEIQRLVGKEIDVNTLVQFLG